MNSPVEIPYRSFIHIDRESVTAIYLQIANQFIQAIASGYLKAGTKILGSRSLSVLLDVHRNTISAAYDELFAQGWIDIKPNKGSFIAAVLPEVKFKKIDFKTYPKQTGFSFKKSILLDNPFELSSCDFAFNDGSPDIRLTQIDDLSRIYSSNLKRKSNRSKMGYNQEGSEYFKEQLSHYLQLSRGLQISTDNLLITRSVEMSLYIISEILLQKDDIVVVGELSYFSANMIFQKSGSKIMTIPVDEEGINTRVLEQLCQSTSIRMLYLTPHQHYPTTVSLSAQRRMEVLQLAKKYGFILLEDDHTYDFQYDKQPLMPLASNDQDGMVIYVGSFGQSLAPGFRTGFIVAPSNLMIEMRKHLGIIDRQGDILMELALGDMIEEGAIHRHLKKSLKIYRERRDYLAALLTTELAGEIEFQLPSGGLAIWIEWKQPINLMKLSQLAYKNNLFIPRTLLYQMKNITAMRIGFGHLNFDEMRKAISILKISLKKLKEIND